jgi:hypothetical protein
VAFQSEVQRDEAAHFKGFQQNKRNYSWRQWKRNEKVQNFRNK